MKSASRASDHSAKYSADARSTLTLKAAMGADGSDDHGETQPVTSPSLPQVTASFVRATVHSCHIGEKAFVLVENSEELDFRAAQRFTRSVPPLSFFAQGMPDDLVGFDSQALAGVCSFVFLCVGLCRRSLSQTIISVTRTGSTLSNDTNAPLSVGTASCRRRR